MQQHLTAWHFAGAFLVCYRDTVTTVDFRYKVEGGLDFTHDFHDFDALLFLCSAASIRPKKARYQLPAVNTSHNEEGEEGRGHASWRIHHQSGMLCVPSTRVFVPHDHL